MRHVACVGSRGITAQDIQFLTKIGYQLVSAGWTVHSGGAQGADQAFAVGAAEALHHEAPGGLVIHLPWTSYERAAADAAVRRSGGQALLDTVPFTDTERALALQFHPAADRLSRGGVTLMTRNVRIICPQGPSQRPVDLVIALPGDKPGGGGTGQALRLAAHFHIPLHDLRDPALTARYTERVQRVS